MNPELAGLASTAANALVESMTTAAWEQVKAAVGALWRRARPDGAEAVEDELSEARDELIEARKAQDEQAEQDLVGEWRRRFGRLVAGDPELVAELRSLVEQTLSTLPEQRRTTVLHANVSDHGQAFQAVGDQHIAFGDNPGSER